MSKTHDGHAAEGRGIAMRVEDVFEGYPHVGEVVASLKIARSVLKESGINNVRDLMSPELRDAYDELTPNATAVA